MKKLRFSTPVKDEQAEHTAMFQTNRDGTASTYRVEICVSGKASKRVPQKTGEFSAMI